MKIHRVVVLAMGVSLSVFANNEDDTQRSDLGSTQELPKILYVVPWKDSNSKKASNPKLVLHNLMGDLYEPQLASDWESQ